MYLFLLCGLMDVGALRYDQLPGYTFFEEMIQLGNPGAETSLVVHEDCMPLFIERLFLVARAALPGEKSAKKRRRQERAFVADILEGMWGVSFLFLEKQATERLFYKNVNTSLLGQNLILFTCPEKIQKNFKYIPMSQNRPWEGITVVVLYGKRLERAAVFGKGGGKP